MTDPPVRQGGTPNQALIDSVSELLWDQLQRDPEDRDRRQTIWGTKTREGLAACILRLVDEAYPERAAAGELLATCKEALEGFRLTREYVGEATLPAIEGWSWFDASVKLRAAIALAQPQPQEAQR